MDLRLENSCNHRIINELLKIKGSFPNYYAILNYPATGNNHKIIIKDQNNLFKDNFEEVPFTLGENNRTIVFTNIDKDLEQVYPKQYFYATYYTSQSTCPRCLGQNGKIFDVSLNPIGKFNTIDGFKSLIQKFKKALITQLGSNYFNEEYGTNIIKMIGKPKTALSVLIVQQYISDTADFIKVQQQKNFDSLTDSEKLLKIDNFQVMPNDNPKMINLSFDLYNYAWQNQKIEIAL
ncbi:MAG: hypothetical protein NC222_06465 [Staphylococcus sp.]|nr:hypothetical protein [Staphylococcus sp.]